MNETTQNKTPEGHPEKHITESDMKRVCDIEDPNCVPLACTDEACFIPGSELDYHQPEIMPDKEEKSV